MENIIVAPDGTVYFRDDRSPQLLPGEFVGHRKHIFPIKEGAATPEGQ